MRKTWIICVVVAVVVSCKKEPKGGGSTPAPAAADTASVAEADALWALAPKTATIGGVITGRALARIDAALDVAKPILAKLPGGADGARGIDEMRQELRGTGATYADAGIDLARGAAWFSDGTDLVAVLPIGDRAKFVATHGGTRDGDLDRIKDAVCKPVGKVYACAKDAAGLALGGGALGKQAGVGGVRGEAELVATLPALPPGAPIQPSGPITAVINLRRGEVVVRAHLPGKLTGPLAAFATSPHASIDVEHAAGFLIAPIAPMAGSAPPVEVVPGVELAALLGSVAGPLQIVTPVGAKDIDLRLPLADPALATKLVDGCSALAAVVPTTAIGPGACEIGPLPQLGVTGDVWVEGKQLRGARTKGVTPVAVGTSPPSAVGKELAGYTVAFWGHGAGITLPAGMPPEVQAGVAALSYLSEFGIGVNVTADGVSLLAVVRTIHANPDAVVARIEAAIGSGDSTALATIATANPGTPIAADSAAGPLGLTAPTMVIGMLAAVAIPAFLEYQQAGKHNEAELVLNRLGKTAKVYYMENAGFPVGKTGPTPADECCTQPGHVCAPDPAMWAKDPVWNKLDFTIEDQHQFRYSYEGTATEFTAIASADLDCDAEGTTTYVLHGTVDPDGHPVLEMSQAPGAD